MEVWTVEILERAFSILRKTVLRPNWRVEKFEPDVVDRLDPRVLRPR